MLALAGRGALIAGTRRIGATIVERLVREGIRPAILYRHSRDEADALYESVRTRIDRACVVQADLAVEAEVAKAVATAQAELGDLSFCINLASDYPRAPFETQDAAAWDRGLNAARGAYLLALHAGRAMQANDGPTRGHIIMFGDWAAEETPYIDFLPYLTAKAAVHFMTRAFAQELAPHGVLVNAILPGPTARETSVTSGPEWAEALLRTPLHRESSEEDMAELVASLLRLETITGECFRVDSGRHIVGVGLPADLKE
jgi:NAD(P)-dependent dehydrogenase (short-subunit alcohol dehydrogenase family)